MIDKEELTRAVRLQQSTYRLLRWLESHIAEGRVSAKRAHEHTETPIAAADWISKLTPTLPADCRPGSDDPEELTAFANMFSSYLIDSYDFDDDSGLWPGKTPHRPWSGGDCLCPVCFRLDSIRHLRPKQLTRHDKKRARKLKAQYLRQLALDAGESLSDKKANSIIDDPDLFEDVAMATYGEQLILRAAGHAEGPAVLALWREFAWTRTGAPKKGFKLDADIILKSEERVLERLNTM